jgi:hypothetical protein
MAFGALVQTLVSRRSVVTIEQAKSAVAGIQQSEQRGDSAVTRAARAASGRPTDVLCVTELLAQRPEYGLTLK